jgi:PAS domain S-box-containing protein
VQRRTRELMEANQRAEASELRYRSLVERSPDGILVTRAGRIEFANRAAAALLGAGSREEMVRTSAAELLTPASRARARNLLSLSGGGMFRTDLSLLRLDGRKVQVEAAASVVYRSGKRAVQVVFRDITERKQLEDELALYQRQLRKLAAQVSRTAEAERNRAAGEFHDTVGQLLGLMQIKLDQLRAEGLDHAADRMVAELKSIADQAIEQTQTLTAELSPPVLRQLGLSPALEWLAENFCKRYGVACSFSGDDAPKNVPADKKMFLYQAARELVHNAVKHGAPSQVQITAGRLDHSLRVSVTDDGSGFDPAVLDHHVDQRGGFGLFSIKVRLEEWNGHFLVDSEPGKGTTVTMILPM